MSQLKKIKTLTKTLKITLLAGLLVVGILSALPARTSAEEFTAAECQQHYTGVSLENCLAAARDNPTAQTLDSCQKDQRARLLGIIPKWYKYLPYKSINSKCTVSIDLNSQGQGGRNIGVSQLLPIGLAVIEMLLAVVGVVSVVFVMIGGFHYITSQGEPENTKSAQNTIVNALIGGTIAIVATAVVTFIGGKFR